MEWSRSPSAGNARQHSMVYVGRGEFNKYKRDFDMSRRRRASIYRNSADNRRMKLYSANAHPA